MLAYQEPPSSYLLMTALCRTGPSGSYFHQPCQNAERPEHAVIWINTGEEKCLYRKQKCGVSNSGFPNFNFNFQMSALKTQAECQKGWLLNSPPIAVLKINDAVSRESQSRQFTPRPLNRSLDEFCRHNQRASWNRDCHHGVGGHASVCGTPQWFSALTDVGRGLVCKSSNKTIEGSRDKRRGPVKGNHGRAFLAAKYRTRYLRSVEMYIYMTFFTHTIILRIGIQFRWLCLWLKLNLWWYNNYFKRLIYSLYNEVIN